MKLTDDPNEPVREAEEQLQETIQAAARRQSAVQSELANLRSEYAERLFALAMHRPNDIARKLELRAQIRDLEAELDHSPLLTPRIRAGRGPGDTGTGPVMLGSVTPALERESALPTTATPSPWAN
jgi:hypothetical protein